MVRDKNSQSCKPRHSNGHEEGLGGVYLSAEVLNPPLDEIATWEPL